MFRMFHSTTNTNSNTRGSLPRNMTISNNSLQFTSKVSSIFQIYNTKTYSCGSCGGK